MTKRIFRSIFIVACCALAACFAVVTAILYEHLTDVQKESLQNRTELAAHGVESDGVEWLDGLTTGGARYTLVASDGTVIYDSEADVASMGNHAQREEIAEAIENGYGESSRQSATMSEKTIYRAVRLSDGTVLRVSFRQRTILSLLAGMVYPMIAILLLSIVLAAVLASRLAKRIVGPLNQIDLDEPFENDVYEELAPLLTRIERQHRQIASQLSSIQEQKDEFKAVTGSMSEGLILVNGEGDILSINRAAMRLFNTDGSCVGKDILTVDRSSSMQKLLSEATSGRRGEAEFELGSGRYQLDSSPIITDGKVKGICILAFDITDKAMAEKQRREFSANVSHELKSPLHAIMGSAELIENGLVKPEDLNRFAGRIRDEASRLVTLIDDIIRLSQLDEGGALPNENVNITELAREAVDALEKNAEMKNLSISLTGEAVCVNGAHRLIYEIIYNLCDNAIKYNVDGGSVEINTLHEDNQAVLRVKDTGIGIPQEAQSRVFERFYRVDKSHSRETGGTGLGLSIVKHAAQYHNASVKLESVLGKGTEITIRFPKLCSGDGK